MAAPSYGKQESYNCAVMYSMHKQLSGENVSQNCLVIYLIQQSTHAANKPTEQKTLGIQVYHMARSGL